MANICENKIMVDTVMSPFDYSREEIEEEIKNLIETFPCLET